MAQLGVQLGERIGDFCGIEPEARVLFACHSQIGVDVSWSEEIHVIILVDLEGAKRDDWCLGEKMETESFRYLVHLDTDQEAGIRRLVLEMEQRVGVVQANLAFESCREGLLPSVRFFGYPDKIIEPKAVLGDCRAD